MLARQQEDSAQAQQAQQASQHAAAQLQVSRVGEGPPREQSPPIPVPLVKKKRTCKLSGAG